MFREAGLAQDCVGGMTARDADRHREIATRDRAVPDFVAPFALPDEGAARGAQERAKLSIELRRHSRSGWFGFSKGRNLQEERSRVDIGMIVGK